MKKIVAGHWVTEDNNYYAYRDEIGFWSAGRIINGDREHLEDFRLLSEARMFIASHSNIQNRRETELRNPVKLVTGGRI